MPLVEVPSLFCPACRKFFGNNTAHNVIGASVTPMKDGSASAFHRACYPKTAGREAEFAGAWPDDGTYTSTIFDKSTRVTIFVVSRDLESEREAALKLRGA